MRRNTKALFTKAFILILLLISLVVLAVFTGNQVPQNHTTPSDDEQKIDDSITINDPDQQSKEPDSNDKQQNDQDNNQQNDKQKPTVKYYVNHNYFLKPIDPTDPSKVVLLTFDDAPQGEYTRKILDILDKYQAKAIFFINGHYAVKDKNLLKEIYDRGHLIGNHTWWHENLKKLNTEKTEEEIIKVNDLIEEITGERAKYFRPPFGVMSEYAKTVVADEQMQSMNWSLGSLDWQYVRPEEAPKVVEQVLNNILPGSNILMHDKYVTSLALNEILSELQKQGYTFVLPTEVIIN